MPRERKRKKIDPAFQAKLEEAFKSVNEGDIESLRKIIEEEPDVVKGKDRVKSSLLHFAVARNNKEMVELLLEKKANIESEDCLESTPLHIAACDVNLEMVKLLVEKGANIKAIDKFSKTVLHAAASGIISEGSNEDWGVVEYLLEKGAPTNVITKGGLSVSDIFLSKDWSYADTYEKIKSGEIKTKWDEKRKLEQELKEIISEILPEESSSDYSLVKSLIETIVFNQKQLFRNGNDSARINLESNKEFAISKGIEREKIEKLHQKLAELTEITIKESRIEFVEELGKPWMIKFN